jgi:hypothetical protein
MSHHYLGTPVAGASRLTGLMGWLRWPLRSLLPIFFNAWLIVSIVSSPPVEAGAKLKVGLPNGLALRPGERSRPLIEADLLVGGDVPKP